MDNIFSFDYNVPVDKITQQELGSDYLFIILVVTFI